MALLASQNYLRIFFSLFKFIRTVPFSALHRDGLNVRNPESSTLFRHFLTIHQAITNKSFLFPTLARTLLMRFSVSCCKSLTPSNASISHDFPVKRVADPSYSSYFLFAYFEIILSIILCLVILLSLSVVDLVTAFT